MPPLPPALRRFIEQVNRGEFWSSHEVLEAPWRENGSEFYHGLILYASAFVHVRRGNPHGIDAQLRKAERALEPYRPHYLGLDVDAILAHARRCREMVAEAPTDAAWPEVIPWPTLRPAPEHLRGDEPELADGRE